MFDAIIISDIHLGSENCQAKALCHFLEQMENGDIRTAKLIINGDVFDSIDFRRLKKNHWKVLSLIRKLSDQIDIIWLCGNHDGSAEIVSHLLGVTVQDEYELASGQERILILHGHIFDSFIDAHPILTMLADMIYYVLLRIDKSHYFAKLAKHGSKTFLRCAQLIEERSREYARRKGCTMVCCGHTHQAVEHGDQDIPYYNSGCWTERPCAYLTVRAGQIELCHHELEAAVELPEPSVNGVMTPAKPISA
ncbi:MAG: UDP-2,3-diacylglucosamine diphosphatase [Gemmataceae bacterium]